MHTGCGESCASEVPFIGSACIFFEDARRGAAVASPCVRGSSVPPRARTGPLNRNAATLRRTPYTVALAGVAGGWPLVEVVRGNFEFGRESRARAQSTAPFASHPPRATSYTAIPCTIPTRSATSMTNVRWHRTPTPTPLISTSTIPDHPCTRTTSTVGAVLSSGVVAGVRT